MSLSFAEISTARIYDELLAGKATPRRYVKPLCDYLESLSDEELAERLAAVDIAIMTMGITFTVYSDGTNIDRSWPLDPVPRIIALDEWRQTEAGLKQRLQALNMFIDDVYGAAKIIADGIVPKELLQGSKNFRKQCVGAEPPFRVWARICGSDLVRDRDGTLYVLEDNLRVPSGVSYMLENRAVMKRVFPEMFEHYNILPGLA